MKWLLRFVALLLLLTIAYVGTAIASLKGLISDARRGDADAIMLRIDLPRLRSSLAEQIIRAHFGRIAQVRPVKTIERVAAPTVVDAFLAKLLTPENITRALQNGILPVHSAGAPPIALPSLTAAGLDDVGGLLTRLRPKSPVQLQILLDDTGQTAIRMHYEGTHWTLSGIDLPPAALEKLVAGLPMR